MTDQMTRARHRATVAFLLAAAGLGACGGGGPTAPTPVVRAIVGDGNQGGYVTTSPFLQGVAVVGNPWVGDLDHMTATGVGVRGLVGFKLATVPAGSHVVAAAIALSICGSYGTPVAKLGPIVLDHVAYAVPFDTLAFAAGTLVSDIGTFATDNNGGRHSLDVTASVTSDVAAGRANSQYRLRMANLDSNADGTTDYALISTDSLRSTDCSYSAFDAPALTVTFTP